MEHWTYFLFLSKQMAGVYPLVVLMGIPFSLALFKSYRIDKVAYRPSHLFILLPFLCHVLLLMWGTLFEHTTEANRVVAVPAWQLSGLWVIVLVQVVVNVVCFVRFKGLRISVLTMALAQWLLTLFAFFLASMSVQGVWV